MNKKILFSTLPLFISTFLLAQNITFSEHIAPIISKKCTPCHQQDQIAPMPFTNYEEVSAYASMIKYVTGIKYMPPWKPVNTNHKYKGDRQLSEKEIKLIEQWVDGGAVEGDSQKNISLILDQKKSGIENPNAIISMSESFEQYGVYYDQFRTFVLPTNFDQDKIINAIEFVPGNASIVRSCFISVDNSDKVNALDEWDPQYGYFSFGEIGIVPDQSRWYTWHPLKGATIFPENSGKYLPENAKLLLHIHYGPTGTPQKDSSFIKLKFSEKPVSKIHQNIPLIHSYILTNPPLEIPANEKIRFHAKFEVPFDMELSGIMPHSHLLGRKWEVFVSDPKREHSQSLLKITDWDLKWKQQFDFDQPIQLHAGTFVHALTEYDNTSDNLFNPSDPPRAMKQGRRMYEELFLVYFDLLIPVRDSSTDVQVLSSPTLVSSTNTKFHIQVDTLQRLNAVIKNFSNEKVLKVFQNKPFRKGEHAFKVSFKNDVQKGNYYLELTDENKNVVGRSIFVLVEEDFFE